MVETIGPDSRSTLDGHIELSDDLKAKLDSYFERLLAFVGDRKISMHIEKDELNLFFFSGERAEFEGHLPEEWRTELREITDQVAAEVEALVVKPLVEWAMDFCRYESGSEAYEPDLDMPHSDNDFVFCRVWSNNGNVTYVYTGELPEYLYDEPATEVEHIDENALNRLVSEERGKWTTYEAQIALQMNGLTVHKRFLSGQAGFELIARFFTYTAR